MNEYTPTEGDVIRGHKFPFPEDTGISVELTESEVARAIAKIKADAWEEGLDAGCDRWMDSREFGDPPVNPYRKDNT